uniref:CCHC-type domain-containing protein n=1 Tax=Xenopus tropicalis TaxID=8364 RepID=A0A6I8SSQ0_XENTR
MLDESMAAHETPQTVRQWCNALGLNPRKVAVVGPMMPRVKEDSIYEILDGEPIFFRPRVAASRRDSAGVLLNVLIDSPREIDRERVPPDIDAGDEGPWRVVLPDLSDDADDLTTHVDTLVSQFAVTAPGGVLPSKRLSDSPAEQSQVKQCPSSESVVSKGSRPSSGGQLDTPDIVSALGLLTDQLTQLAWNGNFKRLKVFSGADPVPSGEDSFESWRDSTVVSVRDWTGPEATMRRKILESLCCPAVDVVKSYLVSHPDATSGDLIEVLEVTFGPVASTTEMLHNFHCTFQKEKEALSAYLVRVEQGLRLLVSRGVIQSSEMDSLRIRQMRRGTLNSDPVAVTIRAYYQDTLTPGYVALMERVRREEADAYVRVRRSSTLGHAEKSPADVKLLEENKRLRKELEAFKAKLSERAKTPTETRKPPTCYRCGRIGHIQPNCPVPDEVQVQSALCKVRRRRKRLPGKCYKCHVMGHQARNCKTYKGPTVQKSYYEPSISESDSPEGDEGLSQRETAVENPVECCTVSECKEVRQARPLPVFPRGECRGSENPVPCFSVCDLIQPSYSLGRDPVGWLPQCTSGRGVPKLWSQKSRGGPSSL